MARSYKIVIPEEAAEQLTELARRDFRAPRHEAAALLVDAIERAARTVGRRRPARIATERPST